MISRSFLTIVIMIKGEFIDNFEELFYIHICSTLVLNKMKFFCNKGVNVEFASQCRQ